MSRRTKYFGIAMVLISMVAIITVSNQVRASGHLEVGRSFDRTKGELPEGVVIDKEGNIYVSMGLPFFVGGGFGTVWKISPDGSETTVLAEYPEGPAPAGATDGPPACSSQLPQCLHFRASLWISSEQYGQLFVAIIPRAFCPLIVRGLFYPIATIGQVN